MPTHGHQPPGGPAATGETERGPAGDGEGPPSWLASLAWMRGGEGARAQTRKGTHANGYRELTVRAGTMMGVSTAMSATKMRWKGENTVLVAQVAELNA